MKNKPSASSVQPTMDNFLKKLHESSDERAKRYLLRSVIQSIEGVKEVYKGVSYCGRVLNLENSKYVPLIMGEGSGLDVKNDRQENSNRVWFGNVARCGFRWVCPVCASKIGSVLSLSVYKALDYYFLQGYGIWFVTLTTRHNVTDSASDVVSKLKTNWAKISKNLKREKRFLEYFGSFEITTGSNGFHPHFHFAFITKPDVSKQDVETLQNKWIKLDKTASLEGQKVMECKNKKDLSNYITKSSLSWEVTAGINKKDGRRAKEKTKNIFSLIGNRNDLFVEYLKAVKRLKMNFRSKKFFSNAEQKEYSEAEALDKGSTITKILGEFTDNQYYWLKENGLLGDVLKLANDGLTFIMIKTKLDVPNLSFSTPKINTSDIQTIDIKNRWDMKPLRARFKAIHITKTRFKKSEFKSSFYVRFYKNRKTKPTRLFLKQKGKKVVSSI